MMDDRTLQTWVQRDSDGTGDDWVYLIVGPSPRETGHPLWDAVVIGAPSSPKSLGNVCLLSESWFRYPGAERVA